MLLFVQLGGMRRIDRPDKALDDVIYMGRRLDAFTKSVKVGGAGKKPIIVSTLIKIIIEYWMVNLKWDLKQISIEKWTVKLIGGVGKSATRSLKTTTNGREKGLKLRQELVPRPIYIEGIEVITSTGVSQILYQMESCENDEAAIVVIGTADNVKTLVKDIKDEFDMLVHLGKPDMVSRTKMVNGLMKDYVVLEDRDKICNYIASGTSGMVWKNIKAICNECCAHVTFEDVTKTLKDTKYRISMLEEKDATGKEDDTIVGAGGIPPRVNSSRSVSVLGKYELWSRKTQKWKVRDVKCSKEIFQILAIKEHIGAINIIYVTESKRKDDINENDIEGPANKHATEEPHPQPQQQHLRRMREMVVRDVVSKLLEELESMGFSKERYVVPTGRIKVLASRYVVPTSKDNVIVRTGRSNVILAGRTILVLSLPEDHMADFQHLDDARDVWLAVKTRFGGNDESKKMRKSMLKQEFLEFRMQAKPDNEDCNMKFLKALPPSWSQVAITLKTKGGLDYLSFDDLYNKLRTLEINVKGGLSYDSRGTSAPTHSTFISAASTNSKMSYANSQNQSPSITFTTASSSANTSSNEELDIKWQMAMLSVRINRFEKKAGRKMKFNNRDAARFDKKKVKCYKCSELGHFARECTGKQLDSKARYSAFKLKELD
ncbi:ribonuclease H-like domain-containing protein [Tanacetum coccineum]